jgi:hypothetical protein
MTQPCPLQDSQATCFKLEPSQWREDGTCSYCGSISPEEFLKAAKEGCELGPTDKNYKVYIKLVEPNPEELRVISAINHDPKHDQSKWIPADPEVLKNSGWGSDSGYKWMMLAPKGPTKHAKFYFEHLNEDQKREFIELLNAKTLNIGYPGHFYNPPFFCSYKR